MDWMSNCSVWFGGSTPDVCFSWPGLFQMRLDYCEYSFSQTFQPSTSLNMAFDTKLSVRGVSHPSASAEELLCTSEDFYLAINFKKPESWNTIPINYTTSF
jgi:hypothetical protein